MSARLLPLLMIAVLLPACAGGTSVQSTDLPGILSEVRGQPQKRASAEASCARAIARGPDDFPYKQFFAGVFDVPAEQGGQAFCASIVEAVIADELTRGDLNAFRKPAEVRGKAPLGTLLRKLLIAHERLRGQQA